MAFGLLIKLIGSEFKDRHFGDKGFRLLVDSLEVNPDGLTTLDLTLNSVTFESADLVGRMVKICHSLTELNVDRNAFMCFLCSPF